MWPEAVIIAFFGYAATVVTMPLWSRIGTRADIERELGLTSLAYDEKALSRELGRIHNSIQKHWQQNPNTTDMIVLVRPRAWYRWCRRYSVLTRVRDQLSMWHDTKAPGA